MDYVRFNIQGINKVHVHFFVSQIQCRDYSEENHSPYNTHSFANLFKDQRLQEVRGLTFKRRQCTNGITLLLVQYLSPDTSLVATSISRRTCKTEERIDSSDAVSIGGVFL